jgi:hypothetical protein
MGNQNTEQNKKTQLETTNPSVRIKPLHRSISSSTQRFYELNNLHKQ